MKTKLSLVLMLFTFSFLLTPCSAQIPQGFNYQAIARDAGGAVLPNTPLQVMFYIQSSSSGGTIFWKELHSAVTTNAFGLFNLVVGTGTRQSESTVATFDLIDWSVSPKYLKTDLYYSGSWKYFDGTQIYAVPYAMTARNLAGTTKLGIQGITSNNEEALFEVKNKNGQTIFAVYNEGVRIYVDDGAKGPKGGFAVGGFDMTKATKREYLIVNDDSVRIYLDTNPATKGKKSGFAVGGYDVTKGSVQNYLDVSDDSVRIYIDSNPATKGTRGGFAVGGYDLTKGVLSNYLNVNTDESGIINPAQSRILWYPLKNAFLSGNILIETPANVGENSFTSGFQSQARGNYSQSMGYMTKTTADYSTAMGSYTEANGTFSLAIGSESVSDGNSAAAIGSHCTASGGSSMAIGYNSMATGGVSFASGSHCNATNSNATAMGWGSTASGAGSTAIGVACIASGDYSFAFGNDARASGLNSFAFGQGSRATGSWTYAIGYNNKATWGPSYAFGDGTVSKNWGATSMGWATRANANHSMSLGSHTISKTVASIVLGIANDTTAMHDDSWETSYPEDPVLVIGNGEVFYNGSKYVVASRSNAFTVLRNGMTGINMNYPGYFLDVNGEITSRNNNGFRLRGSAYSTMIYHDPSDFYLLVTNNGNPDGSYNFFRPFRIQYNTGDVFMGSNDMGGHYALAVQSGGANGKVGINCFPSDYNLQVNGSLFSNSFECLSTDDGFTTSMAIGRSNIDGRLAVVAVGGQWLSGAFPGDLVIRAEAVTQKIHLGVDHYDLPVITVMDEPTHDKSGGYLGINQNNPAHPVHVGSNSENGNGAFLSATGVWTNASSRSFKDRFNTLDPDLILEKIGKLDIQGWYYKNTEEFHIGPVAEDFYRSFGTGDKNSPDASRYLSSSDVAGVSLLAVKELVRENQDQQKQIESQQKQIDELKAMVEKLVRKRRDAH